MTPHTSPRILISGASVTGLTLAYWLVYYGFTVTVVERAPYLRPGGHALDVRGPGLDVAERMGLLTTLHTRSTKLLGMAMVDAHGNEIFRSTESTLTGGRLDSSDVEILRDDLCDVLYTAVDGIGAVSSNKVEYLFGESIVELHQDALGVNVTFQNAAARHFDLVVGADGLYSRVRRVAFGHDEQFLRAFGDFYVATFRMPNFLGLERWQVLYQQDNPSIGALVMGVRQDTDARTYLGFSTSTPIEYDYRDIDAQKRLVAECVAGADWVVPNIVEHMHRAPDFHFYSLHQVRMPSWSCGRIVLAGDAGYSVSLGTGQGTTVAIVGAYVLAGELAAHTDDLIDGIRAYENKLRDYVTRNQDIALEQNAEPKTGMADATSEGEEPSPAMGVPDFGALTLPFPLDDYPRRVSA